MPTSASQIRALEVTSDALRGNPLGDPHTRTLLVYLPPGFEEGRGPYPTLTLLAPVLCRGAWFLNEGPWQEGIQRRLDRLIGAGALPPLIALMPDAFTRYGGSQYVNSAAVGRYRDYILECVSRVDAALPTRTDRDGRAVMGKSSGGFGALWLGMTHPQTFGAVAAHSADLYFEHCYQISIPHLLRTASREDELAPLLADPGGALRARGGVFHALNLMLMSACYSPDPLAPLGFRLPVDLRTGELQPEVLAAWRAHDPAWRAADHADALRSLKLLYFDAGTQDEFLLGHGARILSARLSAAGVPHQHEEFTGGHSLTEWRFDHSLQAIGQALARGA